MGISAQAGSEGCREATLSTKHFIWLWSERLVVPFTKKGHIRALYYSVYQEILIVIGY